MVMGVKKVAPQSTKKSMMSPPFLRICSKKRDFQDGRSKKGKVKLGFVYKTS